MPESEDQFDTSLIAHPRATMGRLVAAENTARTAAIALGLAGLAIIALDAPGRKGCITTAAATGLTCLVGSIALGVGSLNTYGQRSILSVLIYNHEHFNARLNSQDATEYRTLKGVNGVLSIVEDEGEDEDDAQSGEGA